jgi:hypothetical protein
MKKKIAVKNKAQNVQAKNYDLYKNNNENTKDSKEDLQ